MKRISDYTVQQLAMMVEDGHRRREARAEHKRRTRSQAACDESHGQLCYCAECM